jgi:hypothetical protein
MKKNRKKIDLSKIRITVSKEEAAILLQWAQASLDFWTAVLDNIKEARKKEKENGKEKI